MMKMAKLSAMALALAVSCGVASGENPRILNKLPTDAPLVNAESWYSIKAQGEASNKVIEVYIYGDIGFWGVTSGDFISDLKEVDDGVSKVVVHFDTIGGDLFDGIAIHNCLRALGDRCLARIDGACFSAGSVAACGAHRIEMADNAMFMIHNPWTFVAGDSDALRNMADMMDKALDAIVASYMHRQLKVDETELRRMINDETWMTAQEALTHGFVDEVFGGGEPKVNNAPLGKILNRYRNTPQSARELLASTQPEPEPQPDPQPEPAPSPEPEPEPDPDPVELAAKLTSECASAGIANYAPVLINRSGLKSEAAVMAAVKQAKDVHDLCVLAKAPGDAEQMIKDGITPDQARAKLFDKMLQASSQVELDNLPPDPVHLQASTPSVTPGDVYASRKPKAS